MLYGFLLTLYMLNNILLVTIILIQKTKSSMGLGGLGGSSQMIFGGSGGQEIFQKATWGLGAIFMVLSLILALMKSEQSRSLYYVKTNGTEQKSTPITPVIPSSNK